MFHSACLRLTVEVEAGNEQQKKVDTGHRQMQRESVYIGIGSSDNSPILDFDIAISYRYPIS